MIVAARDSGCIANTSSQSQLELWRLARGLTREELVASLEPAYRGVWSWNLAVRVRLVESGQLDPDRIMPVWLLLSEVAVAQRAWATKQKVRGDGH